MNIEEMRDRLQKISHEVQMMLLSLQGMEAGRSFGHRRGRKSMAESERRQVSDRMRKYWAARRAQAGGQA